MDLGNFIKTNKVILIWTAFFLLLFLMRRLFGLVFITFILCFIFNNLVDLLSHRTRLRRRFLTYLTYLVFVFIIINLVSFVFPRLTSEATAFLKQVPGTLEKVRDYMDFIAAQQPFLGPAILKFQEQLSLESIAGVEADTLVALAVKSFNQVTHYLSYFFLSTLFSFLILVDFPNLRARLMGLRDTRLQEIYDETAGSVVQFARVVGHAFQIQVMIALVNTILTALGLALLGIHPIALLSTVVFFCGLIPVLGVFISSAPILILAFNTGGVKLVLLAVVMVIVVHTVETYILNPRLFSAFFKINPVFTLSILYIGHTLFGMWGVLLGVPVSLYIYRQILIGPNGRPSERRKKASLGDSP
ncbi:MAG: AI-2E family transporter [Thermodesulfobacteriota bacterium]